MKQVTLLITILFLLSSCAKVSRDFKKRNYTKDNSTKSISLPELNKEITVNVGERLVSSGLVSINKIVLEIKKPIDKPRIEAGAYPQKAEDENMYFFDKYRNSYTEGLGELLEIQEFGIKKNDDGFLYLINVYGNAKMVKAEYERKNKDFVKQKDFQQILVFNGLVGNKLKIGYRETDDGMARPAFNNDAEYDLDTSKVIGYKGVKIEVIKANNESITYKVIKNFDD